VGKLATMLIIPSSWGSQLGGYLPASSNFLAPLPGKKKTSGYISKKGKNKKKKSTPPWYVKVGGHPMELVSDTSQTYL
jgi:hypothetical protein